MDRIDVLLKTFIATFGGFCGYFLGGWDATLKVLVTMAVIDYLTGMIAAGYNGELKAKLVLKASPKRWCFLFWLARPPSSIQYLEVTMQFVKLQSSSSWVMSYFHF